MGLLVDASASMHVAWHAESRVAFIRYRPDTTLTEKEASALIAALTGWIGSESTRFALLADAAGVTGANAEYRSTTTRFFRQHRDQLLIALFNIGPLIRVLADMFRLGSGLHVKAFATEADARRWLREEGIAA